MSGTLVLNRYRCEHVEPFHLGREHVHLFKDYLQSQEGSGSKKKYFIANSIECRECLTLASTVKKERPWESLDEDSCQSVLPYTPDLYRWYSDLVDECQIMPFHEGLRLLQLWTRDIVYLYQPPEIELFYRQVVGDSTRDKAAKAELSVALTGALTTKTVELRAVFWEELNSAFQVPSLCRPAAAADQAEESKCSKIIHGLITQLEEETQLLRLITCGCPGTPSGSPTITQPRLQLARKKMKLHEPVIANTVAALKKVLDSLQSLSLDNDDHSQHGEVASAVAAGRFLSVALYQLHAQQKSAMWQLAMNPRAE